MSTGPVAERTRGPQPASRTCCPPTSLPLRGGFPVPPSSAPKRKRMPRIPAVCLPSSLSRVPFLLSSTQKGKCCGLEGEGPGLDFPNLARAPGEVPHGWSGLVPLAAWGHPQLEIHQSLPRVGGRREERPRESASCSQAPASWCPDDLPSSPLCPENSSASLRVSRGSPQPDLPGLVHTDHISTSLMTCTASGTS